MRMNKLSLLVVMGLPFVLGACQQSMVRGPNGKTLTVKKPADVRIERGDAESVTVALERHKISGDVAVSISNLPAGVEAVDQPRHTPSDNVTIVLRASKNAALVRGQLAAVTVRGPDGMEATEHFNVSVVD